ncbi:hypothetical protein [Alkaliphilus crotonatoxidans]
MELVTGLFRFFYIFLIIRMVLNIFLNIKHRAIIKEQMEEAQRRALIEAREEAEVKKEPITMVEDKICGTHLQKEKAYIIMKGEEPHYFCSWECRDKFIRENLD